MSLRTCPYIGLDTFTEEDRLLFFGRERDQEVILSNLYAAPLTVFYGKSGVGKSSVLLAGAAPRLRAEPHVAVVVFRRWQGPDFVQSLKRATVEAVEFARVEDDEREGRDPAKNNDVLQLDDGEQPFDDLVRKCCIALGGPIFFIFDQFEEYFLYHPSPATPFDVEFARAVNRRDVDANFLLSMREDGLSHLDRLKRRIPHLLGNLLRLEHMDRAGGERAIKEPLAHYNKQRPGTPPMVIEAELINEVLSGIETGRVRGSGEAAPKVDSATATAKGIETTYLQLVLTRLWRAAEDAGASVLRRQTLDELGGVDRIVSTHIDEVMANLDDPGRTLAYKVLRHLVTPGGTKIAYLAADLASLAEVNPDETLTVLTRLEAPDVRVLRAFSGADGEVRHEIFHDVLAPAILDWRRREAVERQRRQAKDELEAAQQRAEEELAAQRRQAKNEHDNARLRQFAILAVGIAGVAIALWLRSQAVANATQVEATRQRELAADYKRGQQHAKKQAEDSVTRAEEETRKREESQRGANRAATEAEKAYAEAKKAADDAKKAALNGNYSAAQAKLAREDAAQKLQDMLTAQNKASKAQTEAEQAKEDSRAAKAAREKAIEGASEAVRRAKQATDLAATLQAARDASQVEAGRLREEIKRVTQERDDAKRALSEATTKLQEATAKLQAAQSAPAPQPPPPAPGPPAPAPSK